MTRISRMAAVAVANIAFATAICAATLPRFSIDPLQVGVSGVSSGGSMAVQMHVIHAATFRAGAGVVAGAPYWCAQGAFFLAATRCMSHDVDIPVDGLAATTRAWAEDGGNDPVRFLAASHVYLFSGTADPVVHPGVMDDLHAYYLNFVPAARISYNRTVAAGHAMVTDRAGAACGETAPPYLNNCGVDVAGAILAELHGPLQPRTEGRLGGRFVEFDQTAFGTGHGLAPTGWLFVPKDCAAGVSCGLHVVFHGCQQNSATLGDRFVRDSGYARWADSNRIVLLFPQTGEGAENGCWDWWGYDSPLYARKLGPQVRAVKAMVDRLAGGDLPPPPGCFTARNRDHVIAGRAGYWWGIVRTAGTEQYIGWAFGTSTLKEVAPGVFEEGNCS